MHVSRDVAGPACPGEHLTAYEHLRGFVARAGGVHVIDRVHLQGEDGADPLGAYELLSRELGPVITIFHLKHSQNFDDARDVPILAHEYGHHLSLSGGLRPAIYEEAIQVPWQDWPGLPEASRLAIWEEENRAWTLGRAQVEQHPEFGFTNWSAFEARVDEALTEYRTRLGLPKCWKTGRTSQSTR